MVMLSNFKYIYYVQYHFRFMYRGLYNNVCIRTVADISFWTYVQWLKLSSGHMDCGWHEIFGLTHGG